MKRCPQCGTIVGEKGDTCGVCGKDLSDISDQELDTAVMDQVRIHAADEELSQRRETKKDISAIRRKAYFRIIAAVAGATCWILAVTRGGSDLVFIYLAMTLGLAFMAYAFWGVFY